MEKHTLQQRFNFEMAKKERNYRRNESVWERVQVTLRFLDLIYDDSAIMKVQFMDAPSSGHNLDICIEVVDMTLYLRNNKECARGLISADKLTFDQTRKGNLLVTFRFNNLWTET